MKILGLDPGLRGAVAIIDIAPRPSRVRLCCDLPLMQTNDTKEIDVVTLGRWILQEEPERAFLERAISMPNTRDGKFKGAKPGSVASFNYGTAFGEARACLKGLLIPYRQVMPGVWKKHFGISKEKEIAVELACHFFPHDARLFTSDHRAEAALIALYGAQKDHFEKIGQKR